MYGVLLVLCCEEYIRTCTSFESCLFQRPFQLFGRDDSYYLSIVDFWDWAVWICMVPGMDWWVGGYVDGGRMGGYVYLRRLLLSIVWIWI